MVTYTYMKIHRIVKRKVEGVEKTRQQVWLKR